MLASNSLVTDAAVAKNTVPAGLDDRMVGRNFALFYEETAAEDTTYKIRVIASGTDQATTLQNNLMFGYKIYNSSYTLASSPRTSCV